MLQFPTSIPKAKIFLRENARAIPAAIFILPLAVGAFAYYLIYFKNAEIKEDKGSKESIGKLGEQEILFQKQLEELDRQRKEFKTEPISEEEQIKELDALREKANSKPLAEEEIQKQLEELETLK